MPSRALVLMLLVALAAAPVWALKVGDPAPQFAGTSLDGKSFSSTDISGKVAVVTFWASWCKYCREELRELERLEQDLRDKGLVVLAINQREDPDKVVQFVGQGEPTLKVLLDDGRIGQAFGVNGLPDLLILDRSGVVRERIIGYGPSDSARLRKAVQPLLAEQKKPIERPKPAIAEPAGVPASLRAYAHLQMGAAHINIGDAFLSKGYRDAGHYAEAVKELRAGLALDPKSLDLNVWLGVALERSGDKAEAVKQYRAALALDPTNVYAVEGLRRLTPAPPTVPPPPEPPD